MDFRYAPRGWKDQSGKHRFDSDKENCELRKIERIALSIDAGAEFRAQSLLCNQVDRATKRLQNHFLHNSFSLPYSLEPFRERQRQITVYSGEPPLFQPMPGFDTGVFCLAAFGAA